MPDELRVRMMEYRDSDGRSGCGIVDVGVYTKNRNFRLFLSSKFGKAAVLKLHDSSADGMFSKMSRREVFLKSLLTSIPDDGVQTVKFGTLNMATSRLRGTIHIIHMLFPSVWIFRVDFSELHHRILQFVVDES